MDIKWGTYKMAFATVMLSVFLAYYTFYFAKFFNKKERTDIQKTNKKMKKLRAVPIKTVKEQKKFINLKYPKKGKIIWSWKKVPGFLLKIARFIIILQLYRWLIRLSGWEVQVWQVILFALILPMIINMVLKKFDLEKDDISVYLR